MGKGGRKTCLNLLKYTPQIIKGPRRSNEDIISSNILILQNMAQIFLLLMPMTQDSMWLNSMPNSAITVSHMHIPPKTHFQKSVGGVKKLFCDHSSRNSDIKLNFVLNSSAYM